MCSKDDVHIGQDFIFIGVIKEDVIAALNSLFFGDSRAFHKLNKRLRGAAAQEAGCLVPSRLPATMIHSFGKLASKLMATRLAPKLPELISANQNAFIRGRTIHDDFKFVQRAAVYLRKNRIPKVLLKLDISKAFAWPFLLDTLRAFGFSSQCRRWVATLLSSATSRILLNGQGHPSNTCEKYVKATRSRLCCSYWPWRSRRGSSPLHATKGSSGQWRRKLSNTTAAYMQTTS